MIGNSHKAHSETALLSSLQRFSDAGGSLIQIRTREPLRAAKALREQFTKTQNPYHEWSAANGFRVFTTENFVDHLVKGDDTDFVAALQRPVTELRSPTSEVRAKSDVVHYFAFLDPAPHMANNPFVLDLIQQYSAILPTSNVAILFITADEPLSMLPSGLCLVTELSTPTIDELEGVLTKMLAQISDAAGGSDASFPGGHTLSDDDIHKVSLLGLGLSFSEFETHVALSIIGASEEQTNALTIEHLSEGIAKGKTAVIRQSEILELIHAENIEDVGGMRRLKDWIGQRTGCYSEEAKEFGIESPKGLVLVGIPGCLSGDTVIDYCRGARVGARPISLQDLYNKFNGVPTSTRPWVDVSQPTYIHSVDGSGRVFLNRVVAVLDSGVKSTVMIRFTDGSSITLTPDHPVLNTDWDFVDACSLTAGDTVLARGSMRPQAGEGRNLSARPPRRVISVKNHPYGSAKTRTDTMEIFYEYRRIPRARLVIEAHMNQMGLDDFIQVLNGHSSGITGLRFLEPVYEVHHVDEDTMHDSLHNLVVMHKADHARLHGKVENFNIEYLAVRVVAGVEPCGEVHTYDIQMDAPCNNFVANGVIVHNTGKSLVAKAVASVLGIPLVRLDFARVFSKYVGDSETRVRSALAMVEAMAPCVLFVDEIDKGLGGSGSGGGDSGTSMRVLGSYLTWLQELKSPVFNIVTANRVEGLPPELLRRGRFDQIFSVGMPAQIERKEVLEIHLRKRGRTIDAFRVPELRDYLTASEGYVPAEIESAVKDALILAFSAGETLAMSHILEALRSMIPMSKSHEIQINAILQWARDNAIPVNYPEDGKDIQLGEPVLAQRRIISPTRRSPK